MESIKICKCSAHTINKSGKVRGKKVHVVGFNGNKVVFKTAGGKPYEKDFDVIFTEVWSLKRNEEGKLVRVPRLNVIGRSLCKFCVNSTKCPLFARLMVSQGN